MSQIFIIVAVASGKMNKRRDGHAQTTSHVSVFESYHRYVTLISTVYLDVKLLRKDYGVVVAVARTNKDNVVEDDVKRKDEKRRTIAIATHKTHM